MATEACRDWRGDLGMEALGALDEPARTALLAHLDGCAACRAALAELTSVAGALDLADPGRAGEDDVPAPSHELGERILGRLQGERVAQHRRRARSIVASVVGLAAAAAVALVLVLGTRGGDGPHGTVVALRSSDRGVHAQAVLFRQSDGTRVQLHVNGLDDGEWYWLWVTGADGRRVAAGSFSASSARQDLTMSAALSMARTKRVWVTDESNHVVLDGWLTATS